ncbi:MULTISPECIES: HPP family protein [Acidiplasma]|jgi:hypothetical protein|uniref:HPP family protein n=1 Tax=Acidiplasma TaxID=507753 RepID=UPI0005E90DAB|nr:MULTISPECIES: HPP family protein [unclassified Acidiplasma]KJE48907.1 hypothetical protein TZ01_06425 [Acidiplasma sp. MBA-1]WMT54317.1 MAG: HPP family protein [Acidiplasma sp.]
MFNFKKYEILIKNHIIPAIFIGITVSITIFILSVTHIYFVPFAKFIVFSSFASTSFLLFMMPDNKSAKIDKFLKSYIIAGIVGVLGFYMAFFISIYYVIALVETLVAILLVIFHSEHPPAMGIGIVFILQTISYFAIFFLITGMVIIAALDFVLKKFVIVIEEDLQ